MGIEDELDRFDEAVPLPLLPVDGRRVAMIVGCTCGILALTGGCNRESVPKDNPMPSVELRRPGSISESITEARGFIVGFGLSIEEEEEEEELFGIKVGTKLSDEDEGWVKGFPESRLSNIEPILLLAVVEFDVFWGF